MRRIVVYAVAGALCLAVLAVELRLWRASLSVPFHYGHLHGGGDGTFHLTLFKTVAETGWYLGNPLLGAPSGLELGDFPYLETQTFLSARLLAALTGSAATAFNLHFLLGFLASTWTALYVFRRFRVPDPVAVAAALLFAFAPYHLYRSVWHIHLSGYYAIPPAIMVALWLCDGEPLFFRRAADGPGVALDRTGRRAVPALLSCVLLALSGPYYVYFGTALLVAAALIALRHGPSWVRLLDLGLAVGVVTLLFAVQAAPFVAFRLAHGPNPQVAGRPFEDYFTYALSLGHLLAPPGPTRGEVGFAALGPVGDLGFAVLIVAAPGGAYLARRGLSPLIDLGRLNLGALLLALRGGFGELIARHVSTQIRCYNRMSIFIEFMALFGVALLAGALWRRPLPRRPALRWTALAGVAALALWAQVPDVPGLLPDHATDAAQYRNDREFVRAVEAAVPPGAAVFQLPVIPFPEPPPVAALDDYSHFRPYLHSTRLRWSYGATKGRPAFERQRALADAPPETLPERLTEAGYAGLYVNRFGFDDGGEATLAALERRLATRPLSSADGSLFFFKLPAPDRVGKAASARPRAADPPPDRPG